MAPLKKTTCIPIFLSCFKAENMPTELKHRTRKPNSSLRLSLSDISDDPGSPLSVISDLSSSLIGSNLHIFTLKELKLVTQNFSSRSFLGEGGFGPVHKGYVDDKLRPGLEAAFVAVKVLDLDGTQGHREWLAEVIFLGQLKHAHLVKLIGYCCEDEHRLLVYEYMARGNLERQLFEKYSVPLPWLTRIKIAIGAAKGLSFLHEEEKPVIYRDLKTSNVLLDSDYNAKLSDFGLAMDGPEGDKTHVTTRVMGTHGYAAPEYITTGHLTAMSDVYSYGVVLLELMTGKRSVDKRRPSREQNLVEWARPLLKDPQKLDRIIDPRLEGQYSIEGANKVAALAYQCLSNHPKSRPTMSNVVKVLEPLMDLDNFPAGPFMYIVPSEEENKKIDGKNSDTEDEKQEGEKKENGNCHPKNGHRRRHRKRGLRSRAVYSDTALYRKTGTSLFSPKHNLQLG